MFSLKALRRNKTVKYGVPMLLLVVGGSFGLKEFAQIRYDAQKIRKKLDPSLEAKVNVQKQSAILEEEYEGDFVSRRAHFIRHLKALMLKLKEINLDEWKNIRGPRPWEDSKEYQDQQRSRLDKND
ncbi:hypothetical protein L3Q82_026315 [Scortum barcoo]|uniref:Uncharacterized protein n=1 Tax=Scortum barcoo TaxID=214431 RepID=A0ACB8WI93_9TELE|nr:hypothetical protein L3Q82_026315 [Scortum barcoo]